MRKHQINGEVLIERKDCAVGFVFVEFALFTVALGAGQQVLFVLAIEMLSERTNDV